MEERVQGRIQALRNHLLCRPVRSSLLEAVSVGAERRKEEGNPVVIGGMVLDIHAIPSTSTAPRTTTPGEVMYIRGGVARNIADCMFKFGTEPFMISAVGLDMAGGMLLEHWKALGLPIEDELFAMAHALSPESQLDSIRHYEDPRNESPGSLFLKLKPAIGVLLHKGIDLVVVTIGPSGVFLCSKREGNFTRTISKKITQSGVDEQLYSIIAKSCPLHVLDDAKLKGAGSEFWAIHLPGLPALVKRLTGAGDCLVGATVASICVGLNIVQATSVGIAVAKATVEDVDNVPSAFNLQRIAGDATTVFHSAKVL